jgi:Protein of unknown function (DUF2934)
VALTGRNPEAHGAFMLSGTCRFSWRILVMSHPTEDEIFWSEAGKPDGQMDTFWHRAEHELLSRNTGDDEPEVPGGEPG